MAEELKRSIPVSRIKVISGVGHWMPLEDPDAVASAMLEFLT